MHIYHECYHSSQHPYNFLARQRNPSIVFVPKRQKTKYECSTVNQQILRVRTRPVFDTRMHATRSRDRRHEQGEAPRNTYGNYNRPFRKIEGFHPAIVIYTCCLSIVSLSAGSASVYARFTETARLLVIATAARRNLT